MRRLQTTCAVMLLGFLVVHCSSSDAQLPPTEAGGEGGGAGNSSAGQAASSSGGDAGSGEGGGSIGGQAPSGGADAVSAGRGGESGEAGSSTSVGEGGAGGDSGAGSGGTSGPGGSGTGVAGGEDGSGGAGGAAGGAGGAAGGAGGDPSGSGSTTGNAAFAAVRAVFDLRCAGCHNGTGNGAARVKLSAVGLNTTPLSDDELYAALTNPLPNTVPSCAGGTLVVPGSLANSQLISKLNDDTPTCGAPTLPNNRMPRGNPACSSANTTNCLTDEQLAAITTWIAAGAPH